MELLPEIGILGIVEGITEFIPVSSTAHLIIASTLMGLPQAEFVSFFEVFIQSGAILAVIFLYFDYIRKHQELIPKVLVSFIPTAIIGFIMRDIIKNVFFQSIGIIAAALLLVGVVFIIVEIFIRNNKLVLKKDLTDLKYKDAFLIGLIQSFAVIGASVLDLLKTDPSLFTPVVLRFIGTGFLLSFLSALIFVKWLTRYLQKNSLVIFGVYRIILAILLLLAFT